MIIISEEFADYTNRQVGIVTDDAPSVHGRSSTKTELLLTGAESLREQGF